MACTKYATPQERSRYLREHKLCFICASSRHSTSECKKRLCFNCQGPHHTSCCFKGAKTEKLASSPQVQASSSPVKPRESAGSKTGTKTRGNSKVNHIGEQDSKEQEMAICELQSTQENVEKAFLQVRLHELDRDATRCLWLRDHHHPPNKDNLVTFRFTRVTFGLLSSPFLLAATTHFHLDQYSNDIKLVTEIKENLYVDNLLLTTDTAEEAVHIYRRTKAMFKDMNMNLREFVSNEKEVMEALESRDKSTEASPKVLGIRWNSNCDKLVIACVVPVQQYVTKRTVASTIASIYDPMGWMLPLVHKAKIFLQSLWKDQLDWDAKLSVDRITEWNTICANMNEFQKTISRTITTRHSEAILVTFADASSEAIASCVYLTVRSAAHLLMAKGKLPSLKSNITMPKMELNAMTLAMRLTNSVISQISSIMKITQVIVLSDSEIVLNWIKSKPRPDIGPFIRNRVLEIHRIATHMGNLGYQIQIGHISSQLNPADCATRGLDKELFSRHFWWTGPSFLAQPVDTWNKEYTPIGIMDTSDGDPEIPFSGQHNVKVDHMAPNDHEDKMDIFVNIRMQKLQNVKRVVAFALRFIRVVISRVNKTRKPRIIISAIFDGEDNMSDPRLSGTEIAMAGKMLVKQHQLARLTPPILKSLHGLNLRLDEYGIYRCFGRLGNSNLNMSAKYPMFVLQKTWLSELIIKDCHSKGHPSTNHTMSIVHQTYWIPKLRSQVTKIIRMCVPCQKFNNLAYKYPEQGDLPSRRVTRSRPFAHIGLDYFGPLQVKGSEEKADKCYGCIITCLVTRLIHLDIISDASTVAFLQMLRRFFARRGTPISITSDNSPTFALGQTILSECRQHALDDPAIAREVSTREIEWKYITPFAPWQGGVYERLIRSVKLALHKTLGRSMPSQEELCTVIIEIEAMLNTRPLLYVESEYPTEQVLRPIDFLQNEFEVPNPLDVGLDNEKDPDYTSPEEHIVWRTKKQVLESIQSSCKLTEKFWQIWQSHYLTSLREKHERVVNKKRGSASVPKKGNSLWHIVRFILHLMWERYRRRRRPSSATDLVELLAIMVLFATISPTINGCQQVNVFSHQSTVCTNSKTQQICRIQLSEILKINPFKREACFKLMRNSTSLHEIRANWKTLLLTCEQETEFFTRDVEYRVIDSKRCSHSGSCVDRKCAAINSSSLIPELEKGNSYPGTTYCVESCGGPGCDCFYWSSGCLFYRIYASPISQQVFEIFHCNRWSETAKVEFTHYDALQGRTRSYIAHMEPNVPIKWNAFSFTLSSITVPPFPLLSTPFITDGRNTALWDRHLVPPLRCSNATAAKHLQCNLVDDCTCYPAETKANCNCKTVDISSRIKNLQYTLPATLSSITFRRNKEGTIQATIPTMTTSEIILTIQDDFKTDIVVDDALCTVSNTVLSGCYNCAKGAQARVLCTSSKSTQAEITCDSTSFTVKCDEKGVESTLHFSFSKARVSMICSVSCGTITSTFEVNGILKFTHTAQAMMNSWLHGETNYFYETQWPDLLHIADVFTQWYKTLFFTVCTLLMVLGMTYVCISSCGMRFGLFAFRLFIRVVRQFFRLCVRVPFHLSKRVIYSMHARRV
ncbi:Pao retrotransposon peptidase [Ancylostoma ceylanicum]|uniref:Pao retrotransposon peptidase n=1 Tax=Ancylostoma ceylanicum TaxID=53326 RepID=A0A0D6LBZ9_9BILA|nr:Pao retrotransposon peptidase [Ancylostoma ceylanicum]